MGDGARPGEGEQPQQEPQVLDDEEDLDGEELPGSQRVAEPVDGDVGFRHGEIDAGRRADESGDEAHGSVATDRARGPCGCE